MDPGVAIGEALRRYRALQEASHRSGVRNVAGIPPLPPLGHFVERPEFETLQRLLTSPQMRALVVLGPAGLGKTALAHRFIEALELNRKETKSRLGVEGIVYLSAKSGGIGFARLYRLCAQLMGDDAEAVLMKFWNTTGHSTATKARKLVERLQDGHYLLVFDDVPSAGPGEAGMPPGMREFFEALDEAPDRQRTKVLATARHNIFEAWGRYLVPQFVRTGLGRAASIELLASIGAPSVPEPSLYALIDRVEGAPRALELIAASLRQGAVAERLLALLLPLERSPLPDRVAALARLVYQLLGENDTAGIDQSVLQILSTFDRPIPAVGIDLVLRHAFDRDVDSAAALERLVELRIVHTEALGGTDASVAVYSLHDVDADAALGRLSVSDRRHLHRAAAHFYAALHKPQPWRHLRDLDMQFVQLEHLVKAEEWTAVATALNAIDYSLVNHHKYLAFVEALGYGDFIIERRKALGASLERTPLRAEAIANLTSLAWVCRRLNRTPEARTHFRRAIALAHRAAGRQAGDPVLLVYPLSEFGYFLADNVVRHGRARRVLELALAIARRHGRTYDVAHCTLGLAFVDFQEQLNDACERRALQALDGFREAGGALSAYREVDCLVRLSMLYRKTSRLERAIDVTLEAITVATRADLHAWLGELQSQLGFHHRAAGAHDRAIEHHAEAHRRFTTPVLSQRQQAVQSSYLGSLLIDVGDFEEARDAFERARSTAERIEISREQGWILANLGILHARLGDYRQAREFQFRALTRIERAGHQDSRRLRLVDLAHTWLAYGNPDESASALADALGHPRLALAELAERFVALPPIEDALPHEMQAPGEHKRIALLLARLLLRDDRPDAAARVLAAAAADLRSLPQRDHRVHLLHGIAQMRGAQPLPARQRFEAAIAAAQDALATSPRFYDALYSVAIARYGLVALAAGAPDDGQASAAWKTALAACAAPGVVDDARAILALVRDEPPAA